MIPEGFHLLRPAWLLALPLIVPLIWSALRRRRSGGAWRRACDPHLLAHLMRRSEAAAPRWPLALAAVGWIAACLALAGPSWERLPQPAFEEPMQTVFALELSQSMDARDLTPSRLSRARYELLDALERLDGGVGLVVFAEEPYAVTPITDDAQVIAEMVPVLASELMPGRGTRLDRAVDEAHALLEQAGAARGHIVVLADGVGDDRDASHAAARRAARDGYPVSVLDFAGDADALTALAEAGGGRYAAFSADDHDLDHVLSAGASGPMLLDRLETSGIQADVWRDMGAWLVLAPLLLAPLAFRRGWAAALGLLFLAGVAPSESQAGNLDELWQRSDQQGARAFDAGHHTDAAELFEDPAWRAAAYYRDEDYAAAAEALQALDDPRSRYNLGNALARGGQLEQAIAAYDEVLAAEPDHEDARHNRELVEKLLEQQEQQQQQPSNGSESQNADAGDPGQGEQGESQQTAGGDSSQNADAGDPGQGEQGESQQTAGSDPSQNANAGDPGQGEQGESQQTAGSDPSQSADAGDPGQGEQNEHAENGDELREGQPGEAGEQPGSSGENDRSTAGGEPPPQPGAPDPSRQPEGESAQSGDVARAPADGEPSETPGDERRAGAHGLPSREISEHDQAAEQWLNRIPDDPGGLLREKLRRRYAERRYRERWAR